METQARHLKEGDRFRRVVGKDPRVHTVIKVVRWPSGKVKQIITNQQKWPWPSDQCWFGPGTKVELLESEGWPPGSSWGLPPLPPS